MKKQRKEGTGITKPTNIPQQTTIVKVKWESRWTLNSEWVREEAWDLWRHTSTKQYPESDEQKYRLCFPFLLQSLSSISQALALFLSPSWGDAMKLKWSGSSNSTQLVMVSWHCSTMALLVAWGKRKLSRPVRFLSRLRLLYYVLVSALSAIRTVSCSCRQGPINVWTKAPDSDNIGNWDFN